MQKQKLTDAEKGFLAIALAVVIMTIALTTTTINNQQKNKEIKDQVEKYEKTLPESYLEQKEKVAHYRDSLINAKSR